MARDFEVTVRLVGLSERMPPVEACDLFGCVMAIGILRERQEVTFRDLTPQEVLRIVDAGQAEHWFWVELSPAQIVDKITESYAKTLDLA